MNDLSRYLENIGLTKSEIKVYLALLEIGESSKGKIVRKAKIAASKVYDVLDKLIDKGLASFIARNNVKYFRAASPGRIKDYISTKKEALVEQEKEFNKFLPSLDNLYESVSENSIIEVYRGWKGMETVYGNLLSKAKRGEEVYILGAGKSVKELQLELFFSKYRKIALDNGIKTKIIFNESSRDYVKTIEKNIGKIKEKRFLFDNTPSEIVIYGENIIILIRKADPIVIYIKDNETSQSFLAYFNELWKNASKD